MHMVSILKQVKLIMERGELEMMISSPLRYPEVVPTIVDCLMGLKIKNHNSGNLERMMPEKNPDDLAIYYHFIDTTWESQREEILSNSVDNAITCSKSGGADRGGESMVFWGKFWTHGEIILSITLCKKSWVYIYDVTAAEHKIGILEWMSDV